MYETEGGPCKHATCPHQYSFPINTSCPIQADVRSSKIPRGRVFREYIGAMGDGVRFDSVPINSDVEFHFLLSFVIDYDGSSFTNGKFNVYWDDNLTPDSVKEIKVSYPNVRVMASLGGDSVSNGPCQFKPSSVSSWVTNAVSSLTSLIQEYHLDGIDIDYEHFDYATQSEFASCIGQLITQLKHSNVIYVASIAPYDDVHPYYSALWKEYGNVIDYVNFQFYTYDASTSASQFIDYYHKAASEYAGGKVLASFATEGDVNGVTPQNVLSACHELKSRGTLPGIFVWAADTSVGSHFEYEREAQSLLAS